MASPLPEEGSACGLGADLAELVAGLGTPLREAVAVTALHSRRRRATFRLELADGRTLKGRRLADTAHAKRIAVIRATIEGSPVCASLPRVIAWRGEALLEEWFEGRSVGGPSWPADATRRAASLLGLLHDLEVPAALEPPAEASLAATHVQRLRNTLRELESLGALPARHAASLLELALARAPSRATTGFVHGDLCPENIVLDPAGQVRLVDSETLAVDACEHDLARTWYRWPAAPQEREAFCTGYGDRGAGERFLAHRSFWLVAALASAARFRLSACTRDPLLPVRRLETLRRRLESGDEPLDAILPVAASEGAHDD
jgi:aminoglycoside phosphotransferase